MEYFETSARDNINIQEVLQYIMGKVYDNMFTNGDLDKQPSLVLEPHHSRTGPKKEENNGDCKC